MGCIEMKRVWGWIWQGGWQKQSRKKNELRRHGGNRKVKVLVAEQIGTQDKGLAMPLQG